MGARLRAVPWTVPLLIAVVAGGCAVKQEPQDAVPPKEPSDSEPVWPSRPPEPADLHDLVIDVHTHVLNAWDLPLAPFLKKNKPMLSPIAPLLVKVLRTGCAQISRRRSTGRGIRLLSVGPTRVEPTAGDLH